MRDGTLKILVLFVEPMLYGMDLIHEVYEKTPFEFQYIYCNVGVTGRDNIILPENSFVCSGDKNARKKQIHNLFDNFKPDFAVINGYVGVEQVIAIKYCQKNHIPYSIESDTPLNIPGNPIKAFLKKKYLKPLLSNKYCYGFPGGTLQKENLVYYGIPEEKNYIMPMSVSSKRLLEEKAKLPEKNELKEEFGINNKTTFLFVGRLEEVKNVSVLIEAFGKLKQENKNTALIIVGDGSLKVELEKKAENLEDVIFAGYIVFPEIVKYYKTADVFVLPSSFEPWGLVVNEAMILGLPVIASSDVGCRADLIANGNNGYIFESGKADDLFSEMKKCVVKPIDELKMNAEKKVNEWNFEYYKKCFEGAINSVRAEKKLFYS